MKSLTVGYADDRAAAAVLPSVWTAKTFAPRTLLLPGMFEVAVAPIGQQPCAAVAGK